MFLLTSNAVGEMLRYFMIADGGTNMYFGSKVCKLTKFR